MDFNSDFNFDEWARLAKEEPERFEKLRAEAIQELIDKTPDKVRQRMKGLQWQIDQYRQTSGTPIASCIKISAMMWENVLGENGLVRNIEQLTQPDPEPILTEQTPATILEFNGNPEDKPENNDSQPPEN